MRLYPAFIALTLVVSTASCSQKNIQLHIVLNSNQCGFTQQQFKTIQSEQQLKQLFNQHAFNNPLKNLKAIDFQTSSLILLSMGSQSTAGYSIQLNSPIATLKNNAIKVDATFIKPKAGSMNAQVLTSPCALYVTDKLGDIRITLAQ